MSLKHKTKKPKIKMKFYDPKSISSALRESTKFSIIRLSDGFEALTDEKPKTNDDLQTMVWDNEADQVVVYPHSKAHA